MHHGHNREDTWNYSVLKYHKQPWRALPVKPSPSALGWTLTGSSWGFSTFNLAYRLAWDCWLADEPWEKLCALVGVLGCLWLLPLSLFLPTHPSLPFCAVFGLRAFLRHLLNWVCRFHWSPRLPSWMCLGWKSGLTYDGAHGFWPLEEDLCGVLPAGVCKWICDWSAESLALKAALMMDL